MISASLTYDGGHSSYRYGRCQSPASAGEAPRYSVLRCLRLTQDGEPHTRQRTSDVQLFQIPSDDESNVALFHPHPHACAQVAISAASPPHLLRISPAPHAPPLPSPLQSALRSPCNLPCGLPLDLPRASSQLGFVYATKDGRIRAFRFDRKAEADPVVVHARLPGYADLGDRLEHLRDVQ